MNDRMDTGSHRVGPSVSCDQLVPGPLSEASYISPIQPVDRGWVLP